MLSSKELEVLGLARELRARVLRLEELLASCRAQVASHLAARLRVEAENTLLRQMLDDNASNAPGDHPAPLP